MRIAIVGLGLIGGSIGLKLKSLGLADLQVIGIPRREETIPLALKLGAIDEGGVDLRQGVTSADIIILATPLHLIIPTLKIIAPALKNGAVVTDVGSSKSEIVVLAEKLMPAGTYFVGGHPLAGKEKVKLEEAEAGLFKDKTWVLTPTKTTLPKALSAIQTMVKLLGAKVVIMETKDHDLTVAGISHMPLAVAAALVNAVAEADKGKNQMSQCAASGFRDTTRIASGDPELGVDMFVSNKQAVLQMIDSFKKSLSKMEKLIQKGDQAKIREELGRAKTWRDGVCK